jgi:hypothetical protein
LPRLHLFEFEDQYWFPHVIREGMMDYLRHMFSWVDFYSPAAGLIKQTLEQSGEKQIIELCAGGGGSVLKMRKYLLDLNCPAKIFLSDLYPNVATYQKLKEHTHGEIDFIPASVDALNVPGDIKGMRIMFSAFHHFEPGQAKKILKDAEEKNVPIAIFDAGKNLLDIFLIIIVGPISFFFLTPFFRPFSWSRLLFTYFIPLIPLFTMWDGCISVLRLYSQKEMKLLISEAGNENYHWRVGHVKNKMGAQVNYVIGTPMRELEN